MFNVGYDNKYYLIDTVDIDTGQSLTVSYIHRVDRVLGFFSSRLNWDSPTPSPAGEMPPLRKVCMYVLEFIALVWYVQFLEIKGNLSSIKFAKFPKVKERLPPVLLLELFLTLFFCYSFFKVLLVDKGTF